MFQVGDRVRRKPESCNDFFAQCKDTIFEVTGLVNSYIILGRAENKNIAADSWYSGYFALVSDTEPPAINLKPLSVEKLMKLELDIEDEWKSRAMVSDDNI